MRSVGVLLVAIGLAGWLGACKTKMSEKDLVAALEGQGLTVGFRTPPPNSFHFEQNLALVLGGEEGYAAARFESVDQADEYCRGQRHGVVVNYWCISTWRDGRGSVWPKVKALAGK
jgi:hypothetical protein